MGAGTQIMLQPPVVDLALYAGDGATIRLFFDSVMGDPIALTGVVTAQIRVTRADASPLQSFAVNLSGGSSGLVVLTLTGTQTASLASAGDFIGVWDMQQVPTGEQPRTLMQGKVSVKQDVTRP